MHLIQTLVSKLQPLHDLHLNLGELNTLDLRRKPAQTHVLRGPVRLGVQDAAVTDEVLPWGARCPVPSSLPGPLLWPSPLPGPQQDGQGPPTTSWQLCSGPDGRDGPGTPS